MFKWLKTNGWKLFLLATLADTLENIILLYFFDVQIGKQTIIGSIIFALLFVISYKLVEKKW